MKNNFHKFNLGRIFVLLFTVPALLTWLLLLFWIAPALSETKKICLTASVLLLGLGGIGILFSRFGKPGGFRFLSLGLFLLMNVGLFYAGMELRVYPGWDFGAVYQGAVEIAESGLLSEQSNWYFTTYPNNMAVCLFLAAFFKIFGGLCSYITLGVLLNILLMDLGFLCMYFLARRLFGEGGACFSLLLSAGFLPFYMHAPIFYTDTFALPFVSGTLLLFAAAREKGGTEARPWVLAAAGMTAAIGFKLKGSLGVLLVAMLIFIWLGKEK